MVESRYENVTCINDEAPQSKSTQAMLKLTILNLTGIRIFPPDTASPKSSHGSSDSLLAYADRHFSITASVTFTGSCDPTNIQVVSSALCSTSGRLLVESTPVVVPTGMTDGLIATWDDTSTTVASRRVGSSLLVDDMFATTKGSIMAIPRAKPHLFVKLDDEDCSSSLKNNYNGEETKTNSSLALSTVSSLSEGNLDENDFVTSNEQSRNIKGTSKIKRDKEDGVTTKSPRKMAGTGKQVDCKQNSNLPRNQETHNYKELTDNHKMNITVVNPPSELKQESSAVPEILEMQVSLNVNETPPLHGHDQEEECDESRIAKSLCLPCSAGGGAVAHLVLFPDVYQSENENVKNENNRDKENGRIMEIPVRKRNFPLNRGFSFVSGMSSKSRCSSIAGYSRRLQSPERHNSDILIDLEEDATISVRIERCIAEDHLESGLKRDHSEEIYSTEDNNTLVNNDGKLPSNPQTPASNEKEDAQRQKNIDGEIHKASKREKGESMNSANIRNNDENCNNERSSERAQQDLADSYVKGGSRISSPEPMVNQPPPISCSPLLNLEGFLNSFKTFVSHCGDDVRAYDVHGAFSMDSTICTEGSI